MVIETEDALVLSYDKWIEDALRGVIFNALKQVAKKGLPGEHHFYITFSTTDSGVVISESLLAQNPKEMTIVIQYQYEDLTVEPDFFSIVLYFKGQPEKLIIPFKAITAFTDPSINFGFQLKLSGDRGNEEDSSVDLLELDEDIFHMQITEQPDQKPSCDQGIAPYEKKKDQTGDVRKKHDSDSNVIALDTFRKK